jgi:hypothetical protein
MRSRRRIFALHHWTGFAVHGWTAIAEAPKFKGLNSESVGLSRMVRLEQIPGFLAHDYETGGAQL